MNMVCVCMCHVLSKEQTLLVIQVPRHHAIAQRRGSRQVQKLHGQLSVFFLTIGCMILNAKIGRIQTKVETYDMGAW